MNKEKFLKAFYILMRTKLRPVDADTAEAYFVILKDYPEGSVFPAMKSLIIKDCQFPTVGAIIAEFSAGKNYKSMAIEGWQKVLSHIREDKPITDTLLNASVASVGGLQRIGYEENAYSLGQIQKSFTEHYSHSLENAVKLEIIRPSKMLEVPNVR